MIPRREQFLARCIVHIELGLPFIAYYHGRGMAFMRMGTVAHDEYLVTIGSKEYIATTPEQRDAIIAEARRRGRPVGTIKTVTVQRRVLKKSINAFRKIIAQLQKDPKTWDLWVVEFDGLGVRTEGGDELHALQTIPISADGH